MNLQIVLLHSDECCIFRPELFYWIRMIYLAPLQGFTDFVYRNAYAAVFRSVDAFYIPYITTKGSQVLRKYEKEVIPENNVHGKSVPQVLAKDEEELVDLCSLLRDFGYREINLNLGCPYPMVTNRGKGSKLLTEPETLEKMLASFFDKFDLQLSVKMRAGFELEKEIEQIMPVFNRFPLEKVIVHPRIAKQLYKGEISESAFQFAVDNLNHTPVFNGDVFSLKDYKNRAERFHEVQDWMLGRGILMDVFLPDKIKGRIFSEDEQRNLLVAFHNEILEGYLQTSDNSGNALNKIQQFWSYFSYHFERQKMLFKLIKKLKDPDQLKREVEIIIRSEELITRP